MKKRIETKAAASATSRRARAVIDLLLKELLAGLKDPKLQNDEWKIRFAGKQNPVLQLQKLVQALAALPEDAPKKRKGTSAEQHAELMLNHEELQLLTEWLKDGKK